MSTLCFHKNNLSNVRPYPKKKIYLAGHRQFEETKYVFYNEYQKQNPNNVYKLMILYRRDTGTIFIYNLFWKDSQNVFLNSQQVINLVFLQITIFLF